MSGKADSIHVNHESGLTQLININTPGSSAAFSTARKPILWNLGNQMTGDTIHLQSDTVKDKMDSLIVFNHAFLISKDTLGDGFNQINGKKLVGLFNDKNELYHVDIIKNAQSIYYFRNENNELVGIDKSKSGLINILIQDNAIEEVRKINQIDGNIYPESKFPKNERILKGFDWREDERPNSVEDLFKDDPPLELPVIKGLDDYIPEEDFFDEDLTNRINLGKKNRALSSRGRINKQRNLLRSKHNFKDHWNSKGVQVIKTSVLAPNKKNEVSEIKGKASGNNYLYHHIDSTEGEFKFSIWLKGKGTIQLVIQEHGGDFTRYKTMNVSLKDKWEKYSISSVKADDGNKVRVMICEVQNTDTVYLWNSSLTMID
ncbi:hypothetical protein JCM19301_2860 [Jejuia pallidilutea]|uniref:Uncharacterized protein n=3 Tax=Jejuia pallidilutea TaxID=504487 RepID=A0A090VVF9_9FLAO|nr:hypothetical protein JCM19301_2860 [Jejuia pallidilutea]